ncbi:hypothetical protein ANANG_G00097490 [Anguilla anguilla]|uniref:Uncharacterized protein n=1 Tax=Anguilla anguilla TaxID=7936 RepID=A0A9D3MG35_ANGAN|nr:hypothetical protein ANANG_G00097490 [Anguilla anguilla]
MKPVTASLKPYCMYSKRSSFPVTERLVGFFSSSSSFTVASPTAMLVSPLQYTMSLRSVVTSSISAPMGLRNGWRGKLRSVGKGSRVCLSGLVFDKGKKGPCSTENGKRPLRPGLP